MSLTDDMLLEGYRDPKEVYIALRTDGLKGSGTIDDPYHGGTSHGPPLSSSLTVKRTVFVVGLKNHGLSVGSLVTITGVQIPGDPIFNVVNSAVTEILSPSHFTLDLPSVPFAPPNNRYSYTPAIQANGIDCRLYWPVARVSIPVSHGLGLFDGVSLSGSSLPVGYVGDYPILGPNGSSGTVFACRLYFLPSADVTTPINCEVQRLQHRFDEVMRTVPKYSVIHVGEGEFETRGYASLHTSHLVDFSQLYCGFVMREGQRLLGSGIAATRLKLVLPLDDLNQTTVIANPSSPKANYSEVANLTADANSVGHVNPYGIAPAPVTCGAVSLGGRFMRLNRVRAIGFCTQAYPECFPLSLGPATDDPAPVFNVLENCILEQPGENNTHETTLLKSNGNHYARGLSPIVLHNYANCWYVSRNASSAYVAIASIVQDTSDLTKFTLTTKTPHFRDVGNNVHLNGVAAPAGVLNAAFPVDTWVSDKILTFKVTGNTTAYSSIDASGAYLGVDYHGPLPGNATGAVVEGNALFECAQGIYQDTGSSQDTVIRDNYFSNCQRALNFDFNPVGGGVLAAQDAKTLMRSVVGGKFIATFTLADDEADLQVAVGDAVTISGARIGGLTAPAAPYNGTFVIVSIDTNKRAFSYEMATDPINNADSITDPPTAFQARNQVRRLVFENNLCDLIPFDINTSTQNLVPRGMQSVAFKDGPPFMFPTAVIRDNSFRLKDGVAPMVNAGGNYLFALRITSFDNTLVEGNQVGFSTPHVLHYAYGGRVMGFNNAAPDGTAIPVFEDAGGGATGPFVEQDSLELRVQDSLLMSLL